MCDFAGEVGADHWIDVHHASTFNVKASRRTAALDQAQNNMLMAGTAPLGLALHAAVESFVNLNNFAAAAEWF